MDARAHYRALASHTTRGTTSLGPIDVDLGGITAAIGFDEGQGVTAVAPDFSDFQNRSNVVAPMGRGYEYVTECDLPGHAAQWGEEAAAKLKAKPVEVGKYDLILHPSHLWLTIHESIGHPTELDRALGYEANYAGTSFIAPPEKMLGKLKYGPAFMNVQGDRSQPGACATIGYDDEGVKPEDFLIVKNGIFNDYQTTREQAGMLKWWYDKQGLPTKSHGLPSTGL